MTESPEKPSLVFVHGYLGGSQQWADQVIALSAHFNVITPDLPGFGLNNQRSAPESISGFADYVLDELTQQGIGRFHLVGHSMGGMVAQQMVSQAPQGIDKLVLYGTGPVGVMPGRFETIDESKKRLKSGGVSSAARHIAAKWFLHGTDAEAYPACAEIAVQTSEQGALAGLIAMQAWSGKNALANIASPTLVLWGDKDQSYQWHLPEMLWHEIPNSSLSVIAGCSHAVHLEKPALFNTILLDYLLDQ